MQPVGTTSLQLHINLHFWPTWHRLLYNLYFYKFGFAVVHYFSHVLSLATESDVWFVTLISILLLDEWRSCWQWAHLLWATPPVTSLDDTMFSLFCNVFSVGLEKHLCFLSVTWTPFPLPAGVEETLLVCFPHSSGSFLGLVLHKWMYFYLNFYIYDGCRHHKLWEIIKTVKSKCVRMIRFKILPWFFACTAIITELH